MKSALVVLAEGAEEMETVITVDVLRRGKVDVTVAGLDSSNPIKCSRGVYIKPDTTLEMAKGKGLYDVVVMPGGDAGAKALGKSPVVKDVLVEHEKNGKLIAAICAAPTALVTHGIGTGKRITSYPTLGGHFTGYEYQDERVVKDGTLITSRGPGTTMEFAVEIVRALQGSDVADKLPGQLLMK